jgi:hypothetical protein
VSLTRRRSKTLIYYRAECDEQPGALVCGSHHVRAKRAERSKDAWTFWNANNGNR